MSSEILFLGLDADASGVSTCRVDKSQRIQIAISGKRLKALRTGLHMTQSMVAAQAGISISGYTRFEQEESAVMRTSNFHRLAAAFKMEVAELEKKVRPPRDAEKNQPVDLDQNVEPYSEVKLFDIPLFDLSVAASGWVEASEIGGVSDPRVIEQGLFRIRIRGDSMQKTWNTGDVTEFKLVRWGVDELKIGADYYVHRNDGYATFKRLVSLDDDEYVLAAANKKKYPDKMPVARQDVVRMAKAVARVTLMD